MSAKQFLIPAVLILVAVMVTAGVLFVTKPGRPADADWWQEYRAEGSWNEEYKTILSRAGGSPTLVDDLQRLAERIDEDEYGALCDALMYFGYAMPSQEIIAIAGTLDKRFPNETAPFRIRLTMHITRTESPAVLDAYLFRNARELTPAGVMWATQGLREAIRYTPTHCPSLDEVIAMDLPPRAKVQLVHLLTQKRAYDEQHVLAWAESARADADAGGRHPALAQSFDELFTLCNDRLTTTRRIEDILWWREYKTPGRSLSDGQAWLENLERTDELLDDLVFLATTIEDEKEARGTLGVAIDTLAAGQTDGRYIKALRIIDERFPTDYGPTFIVAASMMDGPAAREALVQYLFGPAESVQWPIAMWAARGLLEDPDYTPADVPSFEHVIDSDWSVFGKVAVVHLLTAKGAYDKLQACEWAATVEDIPIPGHHPDLLTRELNELRALCDSN